MQDIEYIDSGTALGAFCGAMRDRPWLALDTEFLREKTYYPRLCLVQISDGDRIALIDPLAIDDLTPLYELPDNPDCVKVLHASHQDLELLYHVSGRVPGPIFDTQLAAPLAGHGEQPGYAALVQKTLGVQLQKGHARTDWNRRPLSREQLEYAADDVRYLGKVYLNIRDDLDRRGRLAWLNDELAALTDERRYRTEPGDAWQRLKGTDRLKADQFSVLKALAAWREERAMAIDRPRQWLLRDETLMDIARLRPKDRQALSRLRGLNGKMLDRYGDTLITLVKNALAGRHHPPPSRQRPTPLAPAQEPLLDLLMAVVRQRALEENITPSAVCNRKDLERLLAGQREIPLLQGWRRAMVGELLQQVLAGKKSLRCVDNGLHIG